MEIFDLLKVLAKKWYYLVFGPLVTFIIAYFVVKELPNTYKSEAQLATGYTINEQVDLTGTGLNFRNLDTKFNNLIQAIKSNNVQYLLSYRLIIHDLTSDEPFFSPELKDLDFLQSDLKQAVDKFRQKLDSMEILSSYNEEDHLLIDILHAYKYDPESISKHSFIRRIPQTDYISITSYLTDPHLSAFVANALCEEFIKYNKINELSQSNESIAFLENLANSKKLELNAAKEQLSTIKNQSQIIDFELEGKTRSTQLENLETLRNNEERKIKGLELTLEQIDNRISALSAKNDGNQKSNNSRLLEINRKIISLNEKYISGGSNDKVLFDSIQYYRNLYSLESSRSRLNERETINLDNELKPLLEERYSNQRNLIIARSNLEDLNNEIASLRSSVSSFSDKEVKITEIQDEINILTQEFLNIQSRLTASKNRALTLGSSIKQVLIAQPSEEPESSKKIIMVLLAGGLTFFLIAIVIAIIELMDQSINSVDKFKRIVKHPLIGILNKVDLKGGDVVLSNQKSKNTNQEFFMQSLRKIRYELEKKQQKIFLITSPEKEEGKTTFILHLARSLSLINKKILIIDTNFRNNKISRVLKQNSKRPESHELAINSEQFSSAEKNQIKFETYITTTSNRNISFIPSERTLNSPFEVFVDTNFREFLSKCTQHFDYILMEGPSLNEYSDTKELIEYSDMIISVFSAYRTINTLDMESNEYLKSLGSKYLGYVLNSLDKKDIVN